MISGGCLHVLPQSHASLKRTSGSRCAAQCARLPFSCDLPTTDCCFTRSLSINQEEVRFIRISKKTDSRRVRRCQQTQQNWILFTN
eukprot:g35279.t1